MNTSGDSSPWTYRRRGGPVAPPFASMTTARSTWLSSRPAMRRPPSRGARRTRVTLLRPTPPAVRMFDAGMGDGTVIGRVMRSTHRQFPPCRCSWSPRKSASRDVRLGLEKLPDRFFEHPATVFIVTNLNYAEAPRLMPRDAQLAAALNWQEVASDGRDRGRVCAANRGAEQRAHQRLADADRVREPATR